MHRFLLFCAAQKGLDTDRYQWLRQVYLRIFLNLSEGFPHVHSLAVCTHTRTSMRGFMYAETAVFRGVRGQWGVVGLGVWGGVPRGKKSDFSVNRARFSAPQALWAVHPG